MKTKTPFKLLMILLMSIFLQYASTAQSNCVSVPPETLSRSSDYLHVDTYPFSNSNDYCVTVYVNKITRNGGGGGVTNAILNQQVDALNDQFATTGIHFEWDGVITKVKSTSIYNADIIDAGGSCPTADFGILSSYAHTDGIDLFFFNRNLGPGGEIISAANGIANKTEIIFSKDHLGTGALAHEMGHVLGLFHPYHSTDTGCESMDGYAGHVRECTNGDLTHRRNSGDYIADILADSHHPAAGSADCTPSPDDGPDACGDEYVAPLTSNYMNKWITCMDSFTPLQIRRMKYFLEGSGSVPSTLELLDAVVECPTRPNPCENCNGAVNNANQVFDTLTNIGCEYTLSFPVISLDCNDSFIVDWNNGDGGPLNTEGDSITTTFTEDGVQTISITVIRDGEVCETFNYLIDVVESCAPACPDCDNTLRDIVKSLSEEPSLGCDSYSVRFPDFDDCFTGRIDWGDSSSDSMLSGGSITHTYTAAGSYYVSFELFDENDDLCASDRVRVDVSCPITCPDPCAIEAFYTYTNLGCFYSFQAENLASDCPEDTWTYEWIVDGVSSGFGPIFSIDFSTLSGPSHLVELYIRYSPDSCKDAFSSIIQVGTCGQGSPKINQNDVRLYPNPTSGAFTIENKGEATISEIKIRDIYGYQIMSQRSNFDSAINITNKNAGIYFIEIKFNNGQSLIKKLILQK